jgi:hypothetical protein
VSTEHDYRVRAEAHMPKSIDEVQAAARQLAAQNFSDHTVAAILKIDVHAVRQMIGERKSA